MKLHQLLDPYAIHKLNEIRGSSSVPQSKELVAKPAAGSSLSKRELLELMGTDRQTYKRVNGRVRGK